MAVTYLGEDPGGRQARNLKGVRTYTRVFKLKTDSKSDGPYTVGSNANLPVIGSTHPEDVYAWCIELSVENSDPWAGWTVTASYSGEFEVSINPLFEPAVIEWDNENFDEVLVYDRNGDAVLNSAGDPFEDAMRERSRRVVTVVKNVATVPTWILSAEDAVNSSAFLLDGVSVAADKAKLSAPRISRLMNRNGTTYREMTMTIKLNKDGWNFQPLDAGYRYRDGSGNLTRIVSDDGTDISQPVCLDGSGGVLADPTPATAVYGDFEQYPQLDFNTLPLT